MWQNFCKRHRVGEKARRQCVTFARNSMDVMVVVVIGVT